MSKLKKLLAFIICIGLLMSSCYIGNIAYAEEETRKGVVVVNDSLNVRSSASTSASKLGKLENGANVTIYGADVTDSDGGKWYKISYNTGFGYVSADYVQIIYEYVTDADFETNLANQKFPESYKVLLRQLHAAHPNWIFLADHLSMTFEEALTEETKSLTKNLVSSSAPNSQKSMESGAYDWKSKTYLSHDSGGWVKAHKDIVAYYMEPRNFINEANIFLYLDQSYNAAYQNKDGLNNMLKGTFMDSTKGFPESTYATYADVLMEAAKQSKVNPYILAAMILVEQGTGGTGNSISGKVSGYEGYYNFFNIGAYAEGGYNAVQRGLLYAKEDIGEKGTYNRPWNTRARSIIGGAKYYGENYVARGQDTLYYKKYNVIVPNYYTHQYMSNVSGAVQEASKIRSAYTGVGVDNVPLVFSIPVYKNTVEENKTSLSTSTGANNYYLESLSVKDQKISPTFDRYTNDYSLVVGETVEEIEITATVPSGAKVEGTGKVKVKKGNNIITLKVTAASGRTANYTLAVYREGVPEDGGEDKPPTQTALPEIKGEYNNGTSITGVAVGTDVATFIKKLKVVNGTVQVLNSSGAAKNSGTIVTGDKIQIKDANQKITLTKDIVIFGDINSDGKISIVDLAAVQMHLLDKRKLTNATLSAADTNKDGKVSIVDLAAVQMHLLSKKLIVQ